MRFTPELRVLETEIFKPKRDRRISKIKESWAAWCNSQEKPGTWFEKVLRWMEIRK